MDCRCPKKLNKLPEEPCQMGREAVDLARQGKEGGCPWFVADREANFCFFKFMSNDGQPVLPHKIAQKLLIDDAEVKRIVNNFRKKSRDILDEPKTSKKS